MAEIRPEVVPRPDWSPLPHPDCVNVDGKVLLRTSDLLVALLRFAPSGTIHEHGAGWDIDVMCLEGSGFVSVGGVVSAFGAGQRIHWPAGSVHRLWTEAVAMITLMIEHLPSTRS